MAGEKIRNDFHHLTFGEIKSNKNNSRTGLGSATVYTQRMSPADHVNILNDQVIPLMDVLFPDGIGIFQDDNFRIYQAEIVTQ